MTAWRVTWEDSKGNVNVTVYANKLSVLNHVQHCLDNGMTVRYISTVWGEGHNHKCIFSKSTKTFILKREWVIECLRRHGDLTASEIRDRINPEHDVLIMTQTVRSMLQSLDDIHIERVPDTRPIKWGLKSRQAEE